MKRSLPVLLAIGLLCGAVQTPHLWAQNTSKPLPTPPKPKDAQKTITAARTRFAQLEKARLATKADTSERSNAAGAEAEAASELAWLLFDAGQFDEAAEWFAKQTPLQAESYHAARAQITSTYEGAKATVTRRMTQAKTQKEKDSWAGLLKGAQGLYLNQLQLLAQQNNDAPALLAIATQRVPLARAELAVAKKTGKTADINAKSLALITILNDWSSALTYSARYEEAEKISREVLALRQGLPANLPGRDLYDSYSDLAVLRGDVGDLRGARQLYEQSLTVRKAEAPSRAQFIKDFPAEYKTMAIANDGLGEVVVLNNLGKITSDSGDLKSAQGYYDRAFAKAKTLPQDGIAGLICTRIRAITMANIAALHLDEGNLQQAQHEMEEAVQVQRDAGDNASAAVGLANISNIIYERGDLDTSRRYLEQARQLSVANQDLPRVVNITLNMVPLLKKLNQIPEAEELATEGIILARKTGDLSLQGEAARTLATLRLSQNRGAEADTLLKEAAATDKQVGSPLATAETLELQGRSREFAGDLAGAVELYKQSVTLVEGVRATATSESSFSSTKVHYMVYEELVQALIKLGRTSEAFDYMTRSRSKQLQDALKLDSIKTDNKALQALLDHAGDLDVRTRTIEAQLQTEQAKPDGQRSKATISNLQTAIASTRGEWRKVVEQIKATDPSYEKLLSVKPLALSETQRSIPEDAAFVMYAPLKSPDSDEEELYIFLVTRESLKIFTPHVKAKDLWTRIRAVRSQIAKREGLNDRGLKGNSLTNVVGRGGTDDTPPNDTPPPVPEPDVAPAQTIPIPAPPVTRGPGQVLPNQPPGAVKGQVFGSVVDRGGPSAPLPTMVLVPDEPSLSENLVALYDMLIAPIEADVAPKKTLAFIPSQLLYYLPMQALARKQGDELHFLIEDKELVYLTAADVMRVVQTPDTEKAKQGLVAFGDPVGANLPNAEVEVKTIAQIFPDSKAFEGAQVTKAAVTDENNLDQRVVHFATHGFLDPTTPARSFILLSPGKAATDKQLTIGEVWDLPLQKVDLVALSACDTAIGERDPDGTELTTLAEAFSSAGANSVLASLWSVADDSTKDLMVEFYRQLAAGQTKAGALRAAELKVMKDPKYNNPYFWAPFILMGDWR